MKNPAATTKRERRPRGSQTAATLVWLVLTAALAAACGGDDGGGQTDPVDAPVAEERCSFETCDGCCDGDRCVESPTSAACGSAGAACETCGSGDTCAGGACVPVADCTDCDGCCLGGTQCVPGNAVNACGTGGNVCVTCAPGSGCAGDTGACVVSTCDPATCDGCCTANGVCLTVDQQTEQACGDGGDACAVCPASSSGCIQGTCVAGQSCLDFCNDGCCTAAGQCIPFAAQGSATCGGDTGPEACAACGGQLSCVTGACVADQAWRVSVVSVVINQLHDGEPWDSALFTDPLPDPYAGLALAGDLLIDGFTPTIDNTLTPNWNHPIGNYLQSDLLAQGVEVVLRDSDGLGLFETIGGCTVPITVADLTAGSINRATCGTYARNLVISLTDP